MDGTLLNKDLKIDQETIEAIHQAINKEKCVTIAMGILCYFKKFFKVMKLNHYIRLS